MCPGAPGRGLRATGNEVQEHGLQRRARGYHPKHSDQIQVRVLPGAAAAL